MFSLLRVALHHHRTEEVLKGIQWTNYEASPSTGLRVAVESEGLRIVHGSDEIFHRPLTDPNRAIIKGAFGS